MASTGAEDLRKGASQPALVVQARSAIVRPPNTPAAFSLAERKRHSSSASVDSVPRPNVKVVHERPRHYSGISSQRASPSLPAGIVHSQSTGALPSSSSSSSSRDTKAHGGISRSLVHMREISCHLEPVVHGYQSQRHRNSLRLRSRLLGKRAFTPPLSIYPHCPSPPKTSSANVEKSMPVNQSSPWSRNKLRSNNNAVCRPSTAMLPAVAKMETKELGKSCGLIYGKSESKKDLKRNRQTPVPSDEKYTDVPPSHILDLSPYDTIVAEDAKENERVAECCVTPESGDGPPRAREVFSEVGFTAAVRKLTKNLGHACGGSPNGPSGPANFDSQCQRIDVKACANSAIQASTDRLINGSDEFHTVKHPSSALSREENSPRAPVTQDSICAIPENTVYSVMNQISAIHLTKDCCWQTSEEDSSQCSMTMTVDEERLPDIRGQTNVLGDSEEEEFPDELENVCSGNNDEGSQSDASSGLSVMSSSNVEESMSCELEVDREVKPALVPSLFPFRPPTLYFSTANEQVELLPLEQRNLLKWKLSSVTPNVVKHTIARSHFKITKNTHDWLGCWGHHMKSPGFKTVREYQKLNHFPGTFQIGRKDRLWRNLSKMQTRFGKREFGFFPRSFVLPQDTKLLKKAWEDGGNRQKWIIKPPASARGIGIQVIHKWSQMPRKRPLLVQKYLHKPYLISGNKFDLRIYVYVTSFDPLRVYIFNDGLVRFASCKYSSSLKSLGNKFMHLTNYSVNKKNSEYQSNSDDKACQGHKWALKALWQYLESRGINTTLIWEKIKDMVIKTIIASDPYVNTFLKLHVRSPYSCHELFGFDIMLDEALKPWVLEVNISPSLHSNSALDATIKGQMIRDVLNLAGFVLPKKEDIILSGTSVSSSTSSLFEGAREKSRPDLSPDEKRKRAFYLTQNFWDQDFCSTILEVLTPDDVNNLAESEDELSRLGDFERIFPSPASSRYLRFFEQPRYLNILLNQWEQKYSQNRSRGIHLLKSLCQKSVHLGILADSTHNWSTKSNHGLCSDFQSITFAKTTVLTKSCARLSHSISSQLDNNDDDDDDDDDADDDDDDNDDDDDDGDEWADHDVQSVTASIPDICLVGSVSPN